MGAVRGSPILLAIYLCAGEVISGDISLQGPSNIASQQMQRTVMCSTRTANGRTGRYRDSTFAPPVSVAQRLLDRRSTKTHVQHVEMVGRRGPSVIGQAL